MKSLETIQKAVYALCRQRYENPGHFDEFTAQLIELGVVRQTYDAIANTLSVYSTDQLLVTLPIGDIDRSMEKPFAVSEKYDEENLVKAIHDIDSKITSAKEFHRQVALSGIVYVSVYLLSKQIYYMSQDGQFYLEHY